MHHREDLSTGDAELPPDLGRVPLSKRGWLVLTFGLWILILAPSSLAIGQHLHLKAYLEFVADFDLVLSRKGKHFVI